jgi:hypothetical protein
VTRSPSASEAATLAARVSKQKTLNQRVVPSPVLGAWLHTGAVMADGT